MQKVLICPGERHSVGFLAQGVPLVGLPALGESLLACWIEALAASGIKDILVLATDRPELVRAAAGDGSRWGVRVQVQAELKELSPAEAYAAFASAPGAKGLLDPSDFLVLDHLPGLPDVPVFR